MQSSEFGGEGPQGGLPELHVTYPASCQDWIKPQESDRSGILLETPAPSPEHVCALGSSPRSLLTDAQAVSSAHSARSQARPHQGPQAALGASLGFAHVQKAKLKQVKVA